eukprot:TRINITY_DN27090_c0_g1_i1.p1 TRINITY_DN27090_c0_g1~~TRINITY_DN27090_c0_g1_i1.p1  ORF type:complete len:637 (-),score=140.92 TRINITY_DN27090_c0_g1_i1:9-1919(-)
MTSMAAARSVLQQPRVICGSAVRSCKLCQKEKEKLASLVKSQGKARLSLLQTRRNILSFSTASLSSLPRAVSTVSTRTSSTASASSSISSSARSPSRLLPSLGRLQLTDTEESTSLLEAIVAEGQQNGPQAAYSKLLAGGHLENDRAQAECVEILQKLWEDLQGRATAKVMASKIQSHGRGCYIWGQVGGGKSLLLDLFAASCPDSIRRVHFHEFMEAVHKRIHLLQLEGAEDHTTRAVAKQLSAEGVKILVFDEFQITNISDALIIQTVLTSLFHHGVVVLMSTNRPAEELYKNGLNAHVVIPKLLALFREKGITIHKLAASKDFRSESPAKADEGSGRHFRDYFVIGGDDRAADEETFLRAAFSEASGKTTGGVATVTQLAWGRSMTVQEADGGVARFTFSDLCGWNPARCAEDYLQLAGCFHTFLVTEVPHFAVDMHNEARRFTNLIDCLYEHHCRLILSAEAPLEELLEEMELFAGFSLEDFEEVPDKQKMKVLGEAGDVQTAWLRKNGWEEEANASEGCESKEAKRAAKKERRRKRMEELAFVAESLNSAAPTGTRGGHSEDPPASVGTGDDANSTGYNVAGVMSGAVGSLQESGFAARRAMSRLVQMQGDGYLKTHREHRLAEKEKKKSL